MEYPFLDLVPEYRSTITADLSIDCFVLLLFVFLIVRYIRRKHREYELTLFFRMCLTGAVMLLCSILFDVAPLFLTVNENNILFLLFLVFTVSVIVEQIFSVMILVQWFFYVDYTLHRSRDLIRRRYRPVMIPFIAAFVLMILAPFTIFLYPETGFEGSIFYPITGIVFLFYIIASYAVLYQEKKRNRVPAYIRLTPTTICMIAGFVMLIVIQDFPILPLFLALGLMLSDYFMYRRLNQIDPVTGLYNKKYLPYLISFAKKQKLMGASVFRFQVERGSNILAQLLKAWQPEQCKTITIEDGVFLMVSGPIKDPVSERFLSLIKEQAENRGIVVKSAYETDREAPMDEVLMKYYSGH